MSAIVALANPYHAYVFGTSFWYFLRGMARVVDPAAVCSWFRPPIDGLVEPNDLELYTTRTDAYGLLALSALLLVLSDAVPLPGKLTGSALVQGSKDINKKPYAAAVIVITMLHHISTGIGAWQHYSQPSHRTVAMDIGVWGNVFFTALGAAALAWGIGGEEGEGKYLRDGKKRA